MPKNVILNNINIYLHKYGTAYCRSLVCILTCFLAHCTIAQQNGTHELPLIISVCAYNAAPWVTQNLDSIFAQQYENFHLVSIDECSPNRVQSRHRDLKLATGAVGGVVEDVGALAVAACGADVDGVPSVSCGTVPEAAVKVAAPALGPAR